MVPAELPLRGAALWTAGGGSGAAAGLTVHVLGRLTPAVLAVLRPTLTALDRRQAEQRLVIVDDAYARAQLAGLSPRVQVHWVPDEHAPARRLRHLRRALAPLVADTRRPLAALHLHGVLPALACASLWHPGRRARPPLHFYPHSSRALVGRPWLRVAVLATLRAVCGPQLRRAIVQVPADGELLAAWGAGAGATVEVGAEATAPALVDPAVDDIFFMTQRHEARRPLLLTQTQGETQGPARAFAQLAVLLTDADLGAAFNWVGPSVPRMADSFRAAGIGQFDRGSAAQRAERLSSTWVYVAPAAERGFPLGLAEAMAAGVPVLALDTPHHRHLLGAALADCLCADMSALITQCAALIDDPVLRAQRSRRAREEASQRFTDAVFARRLMLALAARQGDQAQAA